jgi:hypothetical protein
MDNNGSIPFYKVGLTHVGKVFDAPLAVKGKSWFPLTQILLWGVMTWFAGKKRPSRMGPQSRSCRSRQACRATGGCHPHRLGNADPDLLRRQ